MASEPLAGRRLTKVTERRTKLDWALFVQDISASYPDAERITLVMDDLNTHTPGSLYGAFSPEQAKAVGPLRVRLHPQAWQLAEHGGN